MFMTQLPFAALEAWEAKHGLKRADLARALGVPSQKLNGWRLRGHVSYLETERVADLITRPPIKLAAPRRENSKSALRAADPNTVRKLGKAQEAFIREVNRIGGSLSDQDAQALLTLFYKCVPDPDPAYQALVDVTRMAALKTVQG